MKEPNDKVAQAGRLRYNLMKAAIRQRARELGFDDCRFTTAAVPASADKFQDWLTGKQHGEMAWLERSAPKRIDPQKVLPGAKSIICLAASYEIEIPNSELRTPNSGLVARYARFTDYHEVLGERLKSLTEFVNQLGGDADPLDCGMWTPGHYWNATLPNAPGSASSASTRTSSAGSWGTGF